MITQIRRTKIHLANDQIFSKLWCPVVILPMFVEDNQQCCYYGCDHDEDLGDVESPLVIGEVVQGDVGEGRKRGISQFVSDGETCCCEDEVDQNEDQRSASLPVLFRKLCTLQPFTRGHINLDLDCGPIPFKYHSFIPTDIVQ